MSPDSEDDLTGEIAEKLAEHGIIANSNAIRKLSRADPPESLIEDLSSNFSDVLVITEDHVQQCIDAHTSPSNTQSTEDLSVPDSSVSDSEASKKNKSSSTEQASKSTSQSTTVLQESQDSSDSTRVKNKPSEPTHPTRSENDTPTSSAEQTRSTQHRSVTVTKNVTGASRCTGEYSDFVGYFRDRYEKISSILRDRVSPRTIDSVKQRGTQSQITIVGMVNNIRSTSSSNRLLELEDPTGTISVLLSDQRLIEEAGNLVTDEVIAIEGRPSEDGGIVYADNLHYPDIPRRRQPNTADRSVKVALISDIHVGSNSFEEDKWFGFADWLKTQDEIEYLLVGGDIVEGVGVYPNQEKELTIVDIYEQYEECAEYFKDLPGDIEIITITGNHDSVRLAEPQPALGEEFRDPFGSNVRFLSNPSMVNIEGVKFLMYHGVSLNAFVEQIPGANVQEPETAMLPMLKKRHIAPMYGSTVRLAPEEKDYLVIDDIPDVLHTGHVHTVGVDKYNSVTMVNSGAWQSQTAYQRAVNIQPDVGYAAVIDLSTLDVELRRF